jgi:hypothetical protein
MLCDRARTRFKRCSHVKVLHGNSGQLLKEVVPTLAGPTLFWLDAHYMGGISARGDIDTPILEELSCIFASKSTNHIILIDDARCFGADPSYPSLDALKEFIHGARGDVAVGVEFDCIRIVPSMSAQPYPPSF